MRQLRDRVPVAADALAAWKLRDMMTPVASSQGDVSTGSFLTNLRKQARSDPEGQAALFTDPAVAQNVRDLETVANQFRSVEKNANASKTGLTNYVLGAAGGLGGALTSGNLAAALSVLGGSVGAPYVAGKMLTSPAAIALASARAGPRPPINSRVAGLLGHLANQ
jgi:alpha-beta hydrolase superfamily lysophospholipase